MSDLARQLLFSPPGKRIEQVRRAEQLHDELEDGKNYPFDFVSYRISRYRSEADESTLLVGQAVRADLRLMIDQISRSVGMPLQDGEIVETAGVIAKRLNVSTKTIARWRKIGLRWRWMQPQEAGRQKWQGIERAALDLYLQQNKGKVEKARRFTQLNQAQREKIITQAKKLANDGGLSLNQVASRLARRSGRVLETIRQLLEHYDRDHVEDTIFVKHCGPLSGKQKRFIRRAQAMGISASRIAERFRRTPATIYRVIHQHRANKIRRLKLIYHQSPLFELVDADQVFRQTIDDIKAQRGDWYDRSALSPRVDDLPEVLQRMYSQPRLDRNVEQTLIVRYHYLNYRADGLRKKLDRYTPRAGELDKIESDLSEAAEVRDTLVNANLPVVLPMVRKHMVGQDDQSPGRLIELLEIGNLVLIESIDAYDFSRGQNFEVFLTWMLMRHFASHDRLSADDWRKLQPRFARSRVNGHAAFKRMRDAAGETGVDLILDPE